MTTFFRPCSHPRLECGRKKGEFCDRVRECLATRRTALLAQRCALAARSYWGWAVEVRLRHRNEPASGADSDAQSAVGEVMDRDWAAHDGPP
jgi:hypothetical protein